MLKWALDIPLLMSMYIAHVKGAWKGIGDVIHYRATAVSVDFASGTHCDFDMLVSMFNANIEMMYSENDAICQYFCFPEFVFCVAIRPGDWLVFNPLTYHCVTQNLLTYKGENVHVSSCYLKTSYVSDNDKSIPLTEQEKKYFIIDLKDD